MKNFLTSFLILAGIYTAYAVVAPISSPQIGTGASNGYVLQTNGSISSWVATSSLNINSISGWNLSTSTVVCVYPNLCQFQATGSNDNIILQSAINAISGNGTVFIKDTLRFSGSVSVPTGTTIDCMSRGNKIKLNASLIDGFIIGSTTTETERVTIKNCTIEGQSISKLGELINTGTGIKLINTSNSYFSNIEVLGGNTGIEIFSNNSLYPSVNNNFYSTYVWKANNECVYIYNTVDGAYNNLNQFHGGWLKQCGNVLKIQRQSTSTEVAHNTFDGVYFETFDPTEYLINIIGSTNNKFSSISLDGISTSTQVIIDASSTSNLFNYSMKATTISNIGTLNNFYGPGTILIGTSTTDKFAIQGISGKSLKYDGTNLSVTWTDGKIVGNGSVEISPNDGSTNLKIQGFDSLGNGTANISVLSGIKRRLNFGNTGSGGFITSFTGGTGDNYVAIGTTSPTESLHISNGMRLEGNFMDSTNATGTLGQVLWSTGTSTLWVSTSTLGISGGGSSLSGSIGQIPFFNTPSTLSGTSSFLWDDSIYDSSRGRLLVGNGASTTTYPSALAIFAPNSSSDTEIHNIGIVGSAVASSTDTNIWGIGGYFKGWTNGATRSGGAVGEGMVTASGDTGSAIGVRGYSNQTHSGGMNIGLLGEAQNSSMGNYALYMSAGNIFSSSTQSWILPNSTNALSFSSSTGNPTLSIDTRNGRIALGTTTPTHSLTIPNSGNGIAIYNTKDQVTNYERLVAGWTGNTFNIRTGQGGTGTGRSLQLQSHGLLSVTGSPSASLPALTWDDSSSGAFTSFRISGTYTNTSASSTGLFITNTYNQPATSSANYIALNIQPTETSVSTSTRSFLIQAGTSTYPNMFSFDNYGRFIIGSSTPYARLSIQQKIGDSLPLFDVASTTSTSFATTSLFRILSTGDIQIASSTATTPNLSGCGTSPSITGSDTAGTITEGSIATGCTVTFSTVKARTPHCTVTSQSGLVFSYVPSTTAITITNVGALSSTNLDYICIQ